MSLEVQSTEYTDSGLSPISQTFEDGNTPFYAPNTILAQSSPLGMIAMYTANTAPAKWTLCGGQAVSRTTYADLFALIGTTYGAGDGTTTFNLPNLNNNTVRGKGVAPYDALGNAGGFDTVTIVADNLPAHTHSLTDPGHNHTVVDNGHTHTATVGQQANQIIAGGGTASCSNLSVNSTVNKTNITLNNAVTGITIGNNTTTGSAVTISNPYLVVNFIIRSLL